MTLHKEVITSKFIPMLMLLFLIVLPDMKHDSQLVSGETSTRCIERERRALLTFKQGLTDDRGVLSSWGSEECCKWSGVRCSNITGHVTALQLVPTSPSNGNIYVAGREISPALLELHHLKELTLRSTSFGGTTIPKFIGSIKSLRHLELSNCGFSGNIPHELGNLTNLRTLNLSKNALDGPMPNAFGRLTFLESLDLSLNVLKGGVPKSFGNLTHLQYISLNGNDLNVTFENVIGNLPCEHLVSLDLSKTNLTGPVSCASLGQLVKLERLDLSDNCLQGTISETHFINLGNLKELSLSFNSLTLDLSPDWIPPFHLEKIDVASCKIGPYFPTWLQTQKNINRLDISSNSIAEEVPKWFWDNLSPNLEYLKLSNNQMIGMIPDLSSIFMDKIDLSFNNFSGPLPLLHPNTPVVQLNHNRFSSSNISSFICTFTNNDLVLLDLSNNQLKGTIPNCWEKISRLAVLNLNNNNLSGEIPHALGSLSSLRTLHLRNNNLSGELPEALKNCRHLQLIDIGGNQLTGNIPPWFGELYSNMTYLSLRRNRLYGSIPPEICKLTLLQMLDLSENDISGEIPRCFNNFTSLVDEYRTANPIIRIPINGNDYIDYAMVQWKGHDSEYKSILGLLKLIDLSSNGIVGCIPKTVSNLRGLVSLNLSKNSLVGNINPDIGEMKMLECLDLSLNQLTGVIPIGLAQLSFLNVLDLSNNNLSGEISLNQLTGVIPIGLAQLSFLNVLDLSNNNLSGEIPTSTQLQSFNESSFVGNFELCGKPLKVCREDDLRPSITVVGEDMKEENDGLFGLCFMQEVGASLAFGFIIGFWGAIGSLLMNKSWRSAFYYFFDAIADWLFVTTTQFLNKFRRK